MMLSDAIDEYLAVRKRKWKPTTYASNMIAVKRFLADIGNIQLKNLKASHVEMFFYGECNGEEPRYERLAPSSFNNLLGHIREFLRWCIKRGYLKRNLIEEISARKVVKRERMRLSPSQLLGLLDVAPNPRDRAFIALAVNTAMRAGDITRLKIGDVNLEAGVLRCHISKSDLEVSKPISADLDQELRRWFAYYREARKDTYRQTLQDNWYLVPAMRAWRLVSDLNGVHEGELLCPEKRIALPHRIVKKSLEQMGLDGVGEGVHTLRRSVARAYFESLRAQGYDGALQATKALLDHADSKVTEVYLGLTHERQVLSQTIAGKPFLSAMVSGDNIVNIADARKESAQ